MAYNLGLVGPYDYDGVIQSEFFAAAALFYFDRFPLVTRLMNRPVSGVVVKAVDDAYRARTATLNAAVADNSNTTFTVTDATQLMTGDILQVESELIQLTADPSNSTTFTASRGYAGTTAATHSNSVTCYLVGNARTGSEVDQNALTRVLDTSLTYPQTIQHPYQIGGSTEASSASMAIPSGFASITGYQRAKAMQEVLSDFEGSILYGQANALAGDTTRPAMRGLRQRISTNRVTSPTNGSAYKPSDFQRDVLAPARSGGGQPDVVIVSKEYETGFFVWGMNLEQYKAAETSLGVNLTTFVAPGLGGVQIIMDPMLRPYTAIGLTSEEVYMGWKREPFDKPRGSRGDAIEGDIIGEGCVILNNEAHHTWVEGVTGFAKQS